MPILKVLANINKKRRDICLRHGPTEIFEEVEGGGCASPASNLFDISSQFFVVGKLGLTSVLV